MDPSCNCGHETSASAPEQQSPVTSSGQPCKHCASLAPPDCANLTTGAVSTPCQQRHLVPGPGLLRCVRQAAHFCRGYSSYKLWPFCGYFKVGMLASFCGKTVGYYFAILCYIQARLKTNNNHNNIEWWIGQHFSWSILISCRDAAQTEALEQENDPCPISSSSACSL